MRNKVNREIRNALLFAVALFGVLVALSLECRACESKAYVIAFHGDGCQPCELMRPVEKQLRTEGYDLREINVRERPDLRAYYGVERWPQYVFVVTTPRGDFYGGGRIVGQCTAGQLRRLYAIPVATTIGAAARSVIRGVAGTPLLEW